MVIVFPIAAVTMRDRPQSIGLEPYGATELVAVAERSARPFKPAVDGCVAAGRFGYHETVVDEGGNGTALRPWANAPGPFLLPEIRRRDVNRS